MKVKCINQGNYTWLTIGKEYEVLEKFDNEYLINGDAGISCSYEKELFKLVTDDADDMKNMSRAEDLFKCNIGKKVEIGIIPTKAYSFRGVICGIKCNSIFIEGKQGISMVRYEDVRWLKVLPNQTT